MSPRFARTCKEHGFNRRDQSEVGGAHPRLRHLSLCWAYGWLSSLGSQVPLVGCVGKLGTCNR